MRARDTTAGRRALAARLAGAAGALALTAVSGCAAPEKLVARLDSPQTQISRGIVDAVDAVDRAFGEPRVEDRERIIQVKAGGQVGLRSNGSTTVSVPLSLRVPLPAFERYANIYLRLDSVADASSGTDEATASLDRNKALSATLVSNLVDWVDTGVHVKAYWRDGGVQTGLRPFVRWDWRPDKARFSVEQQVVLETDTLFGAMNVIEADRIFGSTALLRLRNVVEDTMEVAGESVEHDLIYRQALPSLAAAVSVELGAAYNAFDGDPRTGERGAAADPDQGFARVRFTGTVLRPWLEYEVTPGLFYPWRQDKQLEYGLSLTLRVVFEGRRDP